MRPVTPLHRQVHPAWLKDGHVLSIAFRPFPKDKGLLSVYHGEMIRPESSWRHFTETLGFQSAGVWSVTAADAQDCDLPARRDPRENFPEHCVIDFTKHSENVQKAKSKILAEKAEARGCAFAPSESQSWA